MRHERDAASRVARCKSQCCVDAAVVERGQCFTAARREVHVPVAPASRIKRPSLFDLVEAEALEAAEAAFAQPWRQLQRGSGALGERLRRLVGTRQVAAVDGVQRFLAQGQRHPPGLPMPVRVDAGGVGITPFVAIFRDLHKRKELKGNMLVYSTRTAGDVILDGELTRMLGKRYLNIFTRQSVIGFRERRIDRDVLISLVQDFDRHFYICGPQRFVNDLERMLVELGVTPDLLVVEQ